MTVVVFSVAVADAFGAITLQWSPSPQVVSVNDTVSIGLYAVSDGAPASQSMSSIDMILNWDPSLLQLTGVTNNGPYGWLASTFPNDAGLDGLNNTFADGNALYRAMKNFSAPAYATPSPGLLVTTLNFVALAPTAATVVSIPAHVGHFSHTRIQDGFTAGLMVQTPPPWGAATILIVPEPASSMLIVLGLAMRRRRRLNSLRHGAR